MYNATSNDPDCKQVIRPGLCAPRKWLPSIRRQIREKCPLLNERNLRRSQEPIYAALLHELEEDHYPDTAEYLNHIMSVEDEHQSHIPEGTRKRRLSEEPIILEDLIECFKLTERMHGSKLLSKVKQLYFFFTCKQKKACNIWTYFVCAFYRK